MINFVFEYVTLVAISKRFGDGTSEAKKSVEDQWRLPRWEWRGVWRKMMILGKVRSTQSCIVVK